MWVVPPSAPFCHSPVHTFPRHVCTLRFVTSAAACCCKTVEGVKAWSQRTLARSAPPQTQTLSADTVAETLAQDTSERDMLQGTTPLLPVHRMRVQDSTTRVHKGTPRSNKCIPQNSVVIPQNSIINTAVSSKKQQNSCSRAVIHPSTNEDSSVAKTTVPLSCPFMVDQASDRYAASLLWPLHQCSSSSRTHEARQPPTRRAYIHRCMHAGRQRAP